MIKPPRSHFSQRRCIYFQRALLWPKLCRLSQSLIKSSCFCITLAFRVLENNANPQENEKYPEEDMLPVGNSEETLMRTRSGRVVKSTRNKDFEYSFILYCSHQSFPSIASSLKALLQSAPLNSDSLEAHLQISPSISYFYLNSSDSCAHSLLICLVTVLTTKSSNSTRAARPSRKDQPASLLGRRF